jgi:hypothetical protein
MLKTFLLTLALAVSATLFAQAPSMEPPAELKKLDWYLGEWSGKVKWSFPDMPASEEDMSFKNEWEGQFMKSTSTMSMSGMKITEVGYTGWNAKTKKYDSYTFTNFAPTPRIEHGEIDGDKVVFLSEPWEVMGADMTSRVTMMKKSAAELSFTIDFKMGENWQKVAEGSLKKKATISGPVKSKARNAGLF